MPTPVIDTSSPVTDTPTSVTDSAAQPDARPARRLDGPRRFDEHSLGLLVVRVVVGVVLVAHGAQKLFGAWGGGGISGTAKMFAAAGYSPAEPIAVLGGLIEFGGGILLVLGIGAPFAAAAIAANMAGATAVGYSSSHGAFFAQGGGFEYPLVLMLAAFGLALTGPGRLSLDDGRAWNRPLVRRGLAVAAVVGGVIAVAIR